MKKNKRYILSEKIINKNPIVQFEKWMQEAIHAGLLEPNAMILSTADLNGKPSARTMFLRGTNKEGFSFYTNYNSRKAMDIKNNPHASLTFLWLSIGRQIRIEGELKKLTDQESDMYFYSRPRENKIGTWASPQSQIVQARKELDDRYKTIYRNMKGKEIPRPPFWGGYRLYPTHIEFWQMKENRMHDRILYSKHTGEWKVCRLAP